MIQITEGYPSKIPGETSFYLSFNYDPVIIDIIKTTCDIYDYNKKTSVWEIPTTNLAEIIAKINEFDTIVFTPIEEKESEKDQIFKLSEYKLKPYKHQEEAIQFGLNHDKFLLLDAPGLGKTATVIHIAEELKKRENLQHCLIICGENVLKNNWKNEVKIHSDETCRILGERQNKKGNFVVGSVKDRLEDLKKLLDEFFIITNIETIRDEGILKELTKGKSNKFDMIVVDELHRCKSPTAIQSKHLLKLTARHQIGLTGTVVTNSPLDCYIPLKWIGVENSAYTKFKYYYCKFGGYFNNELICYRNLDVLQSQLENNSLRRTEDLLDLPEMSIINEFLDMEPQQQGFYENIKAGIIDQVDKVHITPTSVLAMVSRLRQATACPSYLTTENIPSVKLDRVESLVNEIISNNSKVVVFSTFKESLNVLNERLKSLNPLLCTGDIKDEIIAQNIEKFQNDSNYKIMLATTAKMGTGITLTAATYAIFIDCPWTYALCEQCAKRIHRIGSKKPVFIYYLWCNDTVDLRVKDIVETKEIISDYIVDNTCSDQLYGKLKEIIEDLQ